MNSATLSFSVKRFALVAYLAAAACAFGQGLQIHQKPARVTPVSSDLLITEDAANNTWKIRLDQIAAFVGTLSGAGDASTNTITSVDGEIVLFSGTTGKVLKRGNSLTGIPKLTSGVVGTATAHKDYASDTSQTGTDANNTWNAGITVFSEGVALTTNTRTLSLPPTTDFIDGSLIRIVDFKTTGNFGRLMTPSGSDTLNGVSAAGWVTAGYYQPFKAGGYGGGTKVRYFEKHGTNWQSVGDVAVILYIQNPLDPTARVVFDATNLPTLFDTTFTLPGLPFTGLIPSDADDPTTSVVTGAGVDGLHYSSISVVPPTTLHSAGETMQIASDGSYDWAPTNTGSAAYQVLDGTTNPVVWNCVANSRQQNAIVTFTGNRAIQINGLASGFDFNLIVKQDPTGGRTFANFGSIPALPTGSLVGGAGAGIPTLTATANAVDWIKGSYTGQTGAQYVWGVFQSNLTAAAPPSCVTLGVTGATSGTSVTSQNAANRAYLGNDFIADATSICKVEANFQRIGNPNYDLKVYICPDAVRVSFTGGITTNGSNTVTLGASGLNTGDVGQAITGPGIPSNTYVGTVNLAAQTLTLSSSRTSNVSVNAGAGAGTGLVQIFGSAGSPVNATGSDSVNTTSTPTLLTGTGSADDTPAVFTNVAANGLTIGALYHVLWGTSATFGTTSWDSADYVNLLTNTAGATGYQITRQSTLGATANPVVGAKARFKTYH